MNHITQHSQRAQTQASAAREPINISERLAFSPSEFAAALGRSPTYGYRQLYAGRVKAISSAGRILIPRSEVERFLTLAEIYNPKAKKPKTKGLKE